MNKPPKESDSMRAHFAWNYGILCMATYALEAGLSRYNRKAYKIKARFARGYLAGTVGMKPLWTEAGSKLARGGYCCYCGREGVLSMDHVLARSSGGPELAANIVSACGGCNASKGARDMVAWMLAKGRFPPLWVLRRYLKLAAYCCEHESLMDEAWVGVSDAAIPFDKRSLRIRWPELSELRLCPDPPPRCAAGTSAELADRPRDG